MSSRVARRESCHVLLCPLVLLGCEKEKPKRTKQWFLDVFVAAFSCSDLALKSTIISRRSFLPSNCCLRPRCPVTEREVLRRMVSSQSPPSASQSPHVFRCTLRGVFGSSWLGGSAFVCERLLLLRPESMHKHPSEASNKDPSLVRE